MELTLKVISGKHAGKKLLIPAPKFLIGRGEDCQLRPGGELVSRHHCVLFVGDKGAVVRDLNSRNGTFVNDERIINDRRLQTGDRLTIGQFQFEVRLTSPVAAENPQALASEENSEPDLEADNDVLDWFKQDSSSALRDTVRIDSPDAAANSAPQREILADIPAMSDDGQPPAKSAPIPLARPVPQGLSSKDSQDAASKALKQFMKGR